MLWFLLVVWNLLRMYYPYFWNLWHWIHTFIYWKTIQLAPIDKVIWSNFINEPNPKSFYMNCNMWEKEAYWRYFMTTNKMCLKWSIEPSNVNHEYVHYSLWNLWVKNKLLIKPKLKRLKDLIQTQITYIDIKTLRKDDIMFYHIINNEIRTFASWESYIFYDWLEKLVLTHWGNEEYITYAIWTIINLQTNWKLEFENYNLSNPILAEIYEIYKDIYTFILVP